MYLLDRRYHQCQCEIVVKVCLEQLRRLSGLIVVRMVGCRVASKRRCLGGFQTEWSRQQRDP